MLGKRKKKPALPAVCAVIVAAGSSRRMGGENKLLLPLDDAPVLAHTLSAFEKCAAIRDIVLVCREQDILPYSDLARAFGISKLRTVTRGGDSRTASVLAGITAAPEDTGLVAVHDGARPLVSEAVITEAVYAAAEYGAAAPVVPVKDSIKRIADGCIAADVPRDTLAAVQTPQVFERALLLRALEAAQADGAQASEEAAQAAGQADAGASSGPVEEEEGGDISNGRFALFQKYIAQWNLTGHELMGVPLEDGSLSVHAHNTYLQVIHDHGLITGAVFVLLGAVTLAQMLRYAYYHLYRLRRRQEKRDEYAALPLAVFVAFAAAGLVEWLFHPCNPMGFAVMAALAPLLIFKRKEK